MSDANKNAAFNEAVEAIIAGKAEARALWIIIGGEHDRYGFALKPSPWEGPGEYQHVVYTDGRDILVRVPDNGRVFSLQHAVEVETKKRAKEARDPLDVPPRMRTADEQTQEPGA